MKKATIETVTSGSTITRVRTMVLTEYHNGKAKKPITLKNL